MKGVATITDLNSEKVRIEDEISEQRKYMQEAGERPIRKELPFVVFVFVFAYLPAPIGWFFWLSALLVLDPKRSMIGVAFIAILVAGFVARKISNTFDEQYERANEKFLPFERKIAELEKELEYLEIRRAFREAPMKG